MYDMRQRASTPLTAMATAAVTATVAATVTATVAGGRALIVCLVALLISGLQAPLCGAWALSGKVAAMAAPNSPWDRQWTRFQDYLSQHAPDIELTYFIRGEIGNEDDMLAAVRRNRVQIAGPSLQGLAAVVPELAVPMAPYLFESVEEVDFVYDNYLYEPVQEILNDKGLVLLRWSEVGWTDLYADRPLYLPEDVKGLSMRGPPNIAAQVFLRHVGANLVPLGSVDIVPALQRGLIQGGASNLIFHFYISRAYASHVTLTHHSYDTGGLVANKRWFDSATPEQQAALIAANGTPEETRQPVRVLLDSLIQQMRDEGIVIVELTPEQRARWVEETRPLAQDIIDQVGGRAQWLYEAILAGKAAFKARQADAGGEAPSQGEEESSADPPAVSSESAQ